MEGKKKNKEVELDRERERQSCYALDMIFYYTLIGRIRERERQAYSRHDLNQIIIGRIRQRERETIVLCS